MKIYEWMQQGWHLFRWIFRHNIPNGIVDMTTTYAQLYNLTSMYRAIHVYCVCSCKLLMQQYVLLMIFPVNSYISPPALFQLLNSNWNRISLKVILRICFFFFFFFLYMSMYRWLKEEIAYCKWHVNNKSHKTILSWCLTIGFFFSSTHQNINAIFQTKKYYNIVLKQTSRKCYCVQIK